MQFIFNLNFIVFLPYNWLIKRLEGDNMSTKALARVKDDINFLEYPNWIVSDSRKMKEFVIEKEQGRYILSVPNHVDHLPTRTDKVVLYALLSKIVSNNFKTNEVTTTRYKLAKQIYSAKSPGVSQYNRLIKSLDRWFGVRIFFEGLFYDGEKYISKRFGIIEDYEIKENGELHVRFNREYLDYIKSTKYYKYINLEEYRKLKRPVSVRLYELLIKTFKDRKVWKINIMNLAKKMTLNIKYPSHVYVIIKPAVNEINRKTSLQIELDYDKNTKVCTFKLKGRKAEAKQRAEINQEKIQKLLDMIPREKQTAGVIKLINSYAITHGSEYVFYNIIYTNNHAKSNYKAYLKKALENNYGQEIQESAKVKQETERLRQLWNELAGKQFKHRDKIYTVEKDFFFYDNSRNTSIIMDKKCAETWIKYIKDNLAS